MIEASLRLDRTGFSLEVDFAAPGAGITALFGPSGCGKTTVLRAVAGLARARGRVALGDEVWQDDAKDLFIPTHRRSIGYVVQESAPFPHMSVRRNLEYGLKRGTERDRRRQVDLDGLVELLGIGHLLERRPTTLSGGERQRVAIARALVPAPRLLLMDEPLAALDAERKAEILPYLERLHDRLETPVLYVSHSIDEVARLADQVLLMRDGHVEAAGEVTGMLSRTDLSIGARADASVVIDAKVVDHDAHYGLTRIRCAGGELWVGELDAAPGCHVRARIMARDVSIARERKRIEAAPGDAGKQPGGRAGSLRLLADTQAQQHRAAFLAHLLDHRRQHVDDAGALRPPARDGDIARHDARPYMAAGSGIELADPELAARAADPGEPVVRIVIHHL
ncbi:MAG: molybdenum ABC transporter ATP-binding protein, partial [Gemmatimonadales bacterium]|nr:molybdenum ABC transporter ATP-binding protein [Gemmatimonadales bacterium]